MDQKLLQQWTCSCCCMAALFSCSPDCEADFFMNACCLGGCRLKTFQSSARLSFIRPCRTQSWVESGNAVVVLRVQLSSLGSCCGPGKTASVLLEHRNDCGSKVQDKRWTETSNRPTCKEVRECKTPPISQFKILLPSSFTTWLTLQWLHASALRHVDHINKRICVLACHIQRLLATLSPHMRQLGTELHGTRFHAMGIYVSNGTIADRFT